MSVHKLKYDDLGEFSPQELQLLLRYKAIFGNEDAPLCPKCEREKSPMPGPSGGIGGGPCLYCIEEALRAKKPIMIKHLPERWPADSYLIQMAHDLIKRFHHDAARASIAYLMKAKHGETNGKIVLGSCAKQSRKNKMLHGWDYIIEIAWDMWAMFRQEQREALLLHEIYHICKDGGQWKLESHTVEEHVRVIEAYGLWKPDLQAFAEAIRNSEEQEEDKQMRIDNEAA